MSRYLVKSSDELGLNVDVLGVASWVLPVRVRLLEDLAGVPWEFSEHSVPSSSEGMPLLNEEPCTVSTMHCPTSLLSCKPSSCSEDCSSTTEVICWVSSVKLSEEVFSEDSSPFSMAESPSVESRITVCVLLDILLSTSPTLLKQESDWALTYTLFDSRATASFAMGELWGMSLSEISVLHSGQLFDFKFLSKLSNNCFLLSSSACWCFKQSLHIRFPSDLDAVTWHVCRASSSCSMLLLTLGKTGETGVTQALLTESP